MPHHSLLAPVELRGGGAGRQDPSSQAHVAPKTAHPSPPVAGDLRQAADGSCAQQAGMGVALAVHANTMAADGAGYS